MCALTSNYDSPRTLVVVGMPGTLGTYKYKFFVVLRLPETNVTTTVQILNIVDMLGTDVTSIVQILIVAGIPGTHVTSDCTDIYCEGGREKGRHAWRIPKVS